MSAFGDMVFLNDDPVGMPFVSTVRRVRPRRTPDPYNPQRLIDDWSDPDVLEISGFIASSTSVEFPDGPREEATSTAVLTCAPGADVARGDRIEAVPADGRAWTVTGFPSRDRSPFTGWRPTLEASLEEVVG